MIEALEQETLPGLFKKDVETAFSLYKEGKLSSGTAAAWLKISRVEFLRLAFDAGACLLDDSADDFARETALL